MNLVKLLVGLKNTLLTVTEKVYHFVADSEATAPYIVWAEDGQRDGLYADGKMVEQSIEGTIHYFTPKEFDPTVDDIQNTLNDARISFCLKSIQKELETGLIHYEWVWCSGEY